MLPAALEVPVDVIKQTVEETRRYLREFRRGSLARCVQTARHHSHRKRETPADLCRRPHRGRCFAADRFRPNGSAPPPSSSKPSTGSVRNSRDGTAIFRLSVGLPDSSSTTAPITPSASILKETQSNSSTEPIASVWFSSQSADVRSRRENFPLFPWASNRTMIRVRLSENRG